MPDHLPDPGPAGGAPAAVGHRRPLQRVRRVPRDLPDRRHLREARTAPTEAPVIHPIEQESYQILAARIDLSHLSPGTRAVIERVIHATADLEYEATMTAPEPVVQAAVRAIAAGAPVVTDVEMTRAGIVGVDARCYLREAVADGPVTRSAAAMRLAAAR